MSQTAVITGCNRGIGLSLCQKLRARGVNVIAAVRKSSSSLDATGATVVTGVDVRTGGLERLEQAVSGKHVDWVIANAGVLSRETLTDFDVDRIKLQYDVNAIGPLRTAIAVLPAMKAGGKIGLVTSRMGSIADNNSGGAYGYRMSKAALNAGGTSLALDLKSRGIAVAILHPGWVQTEMTGNTGHVTTEQSADGLLARMDELAIETSGTFWHMNGERLPW